MKNFENPQNVQQGNYSFIVDPYSCEHVKKCNTCKSLIFRNNNKLYPYGLVLERSNKDNKVIQTYPCGENETVYLNDYTSKHNSYYSIKNRKLCCSDIIMPYLDANYKYFSVRGLELCTDNKNVNCCQNIENNYNYKPCSKYNNDKYCCNKNYTCSNLYLGNHNLNSSTNYNNEYFNTIVNSGNMNHKFDIYRFGEKYEKNGKYINYPYNPIIKK
tara:strand:- start:1895 stop:2539 length:645 start_codon:yes stop_codon:yes gene_type:complete